MPYRFEYEPHHGILLGTVEGAVADPLIREFSRIGDAIVVRKGARVAVADLSAVTAFEVSTKTIHELAGGQPRLPGPASPRFIVAAAAHVFGMARMFQMLASDQRPSLQVVRSMDEVYAALGVQEVHFAPVDLADFQ